MHLYHILHSDPLSIFINFLETVGIVSHLPFSNTLDSYGMFRQSIKACTFTSMEVTFSVRSFPRSFQISQSQLLAPFVSNQLRWPSWKQPDEQSNTRCWSRRQKRQCRENTFGNELHQGWSADLSLPTNADRHVGTSFGKLLLNHSEKSSGAASGPFRECLPTFLEPM